ncbi:Utp14-domain-containing protein [Lophiostoma macrostomum CBS 122681]|uniref:Utp14-domain-containing protein n=1 Tax=Lophiostoma macrostomum CBS 122681 TaxID=1314788 RepID=A0A6A6SUN7_9PLEO|nr:Utp14-domain-containing protein [Lophiostoma macrostomum CBS 122681]
MPPRISRSSLQQSTRSNRPAPSTSKPRLRNFKKAAKRAHDAFSIASHSHTDRVKIRSHRLGESDPSSSQRKRNRDDDEEDDDEEEAEGNKRRKRTSGGNDSFDEGSDSEGNNWTMGHVDEGDEDSDIDSDEAFGESDEERFEGWVFRGSQGNQQAGKSAKKSSRSKDEEEIAMDGEINLDEGDSADGEEEDEDDLGEDAIDLATALDQWEESEEDEKLEKSSKRVKDFGDSESSDDEDLIGDGDSESSTSDDEEDEVERAAHLQDLISSLPEDADPHTKGSRRVEVHEGATPSEFGVLRKVDLTSLKSKFADPEKKKSLKLLKDDLKPSKRNDIARKLDAPLPKRQQDKLDRAAANEKAKETLLRWQDTVKHNRRAEHLSFPLQNPSAGESMGESRLLPTTASAPANDLESTIQSILQQSGLSNGNEDEEKIQKWEELQTNKIPLAEVAKRRAQLRMERELLFREELRAKRINKIKSKAYRRVHRKERERLAQREKDALRADGVDVSEDEREYNDRRRAEERMGAKHRDSKWAKSVKASGKAAWDDDARASVTEMARRNEELRRRMEGKEVRDEGEDASDLSSEEGEDHDVDEDGNQVLQKQLGRLKQNPFSTDSSKLGSMAFMQKAEAAKKMRNDEDVERIRRELAGEESVSEDEDENSLRKGRRKFGPGGKTTTPAIQIQRSEFEERPGSDDEEEREVDSAGGAEQPVEDRASKSSSSAKRPKNPFSATNGKSSENPYISKPAKGKKSDELITANTENPYLVAVGKGKKNNDILEISSSLAQSKKRSKPSVKPEPNPKPAKSSEDELPEPQISAPDNDGWQTVTYGNNSDDDEENDDIENEGIDLDVVLRNQALTAKGFAGDNVEAEFAAEKAAAADEEDEKITTTHLPGWGAWTGTGLSRSSRKQGAKTVTKQDGVKPGKRKDAKLDKVIINQKKIKKNTKYTATSLPFPFETQEQYERSLRLPTGPEWSTKRTFQDNTKPRLLVKQGIIRPMHKPLV